MVWGFTTIIDPFSAKSAGMDEKALGDGHQAFEHLSLDAHQYFLESLGISTDEVKAIRGWSLAGSPG